MYSNRTGRYRISTQLSMLRFWSSNKEKNMGYYKQLDVKRQSEWREEMIKEEDEFLAQEELLKQDRDEMQRWVNQQREIATREIELALMSIKEWQVTCKYPAITITDAQSRLSVVLEMIHSSKLWGGAVHDHI